MWRHAPLLRAGFETGRYMTKVMDSSAGEQFREAGSTPTTSASFIEPSCRTHHGRPLQSSHQRLSLQTAQLFGWGWMRERQGLRAADAQPRSCTSSPAAASISVGGVSPGVGAATSDHCHQAHRAQPGHRPVRRERALDSNQDGGAAEGNGNECLTHGRCFYRSDGTMTSGRNADGRILGVRDTGVRDTGVRDTGVRDTG